MNNKLLAVAATLLIGSSASAGTVYRDRPVPFPVPASTAPCFVAFKGWRINTSMISTFAIETVAWTEYDDEKTKMLGPTVYANKSYTALIVRLATGRAIEERTGDLPAQLEAFQALVKSCK